MHILHCRHEEGYQKQKKNSKIYEGYIFPELSEIRECDKIH